MAPSGTMAYGVTSQTSAPVQIRCNTGVVGFGVLLEYYRAGTPKCVAQFPGPRLPRPLLRRIPRGLC